MRAVHTDTNTSKYMERTFKHFDLTAKHRAEIERARNPERAASGHGAQKKGTPSSEKLKIRIRCIRRLGSDDVILADINRTHTPTRHRSSVEDVSIVSIMTRQRFYKRQIGRKLSDRPLEVAKLEKIESSPVCLANGNVVSEHFIEQVSVFLSPAKHITR